MFFIAGILCGMGLYKPQTPPASRQDESIQAPSAKTIATEEPSLVFVPKFRERINEIGKQIKEAGARGFITAEEADTFSKRQAGLLSSEAEMGSHGYPPAVVPSLEKEISSLSSDVLQAMNKSDPKKLIDILPLQAKEYEQEGKFAQAEESLKKLLALKQSEGASATDLARTQSELALPVLEQGRIAEAEPLLLHAEQTLYAAKNEEKEGLANVYYGLSKLAVSREDFPAAASFLKNAIHEEQTLSKSSETDLIQLWQSLAEVDMVMNKLDDARAALEKTLSVAVQKDGKDSVQAADAYKDMGTLYFKKGDLARAKSFFRTSLSIKSAEFGVDSASAAEIMTCLAMLYTKERNYQQAERLFKRSLEIRTRELGADSPQAKRTQELYGKLQRLMAKSSR